MGVGTMIKKDMLDFEIDFYERLVKRKKDFVDALIPLAEAYTRKGLYRKGLAIDRRLARILKDDPLVHYNLACSLALLGEAEKAIQELKKAVRRGYDDFRHMRKDSDLASLHGHPEFKKIASGKA